MFTCSKVNFPYMIEIRFGLIPIKIFMFTFNKFKSNESNVLLTIRPSDRHVPLFSIEYIVSWQLIREICARARV